MPKKSRSRLDRTHLFSPYGERKNLLTSVAAIRTNLTDTLISMLHALKDTRIFAAYHQRWPQLVIALGLSFAFFQLLNRFPPQAVAHVLFPNSYLPVLSLWFLCWWYLGGFVLQSSTRGLIVAVIASAWLFTRLQLIVTSWWWWPLILGTWLVLEIVAAKIKARRL